MSVIADLIRAGVDPELVARVSLEIAEARAAGAREVGAVDAGLAEYRRDVPLDVWNGLRSQVFDRDGPNCVYCASPVDRSFCCDHVVPKSRGGASVIKNLAVSCKRCNGSKKDRLLSEWRQA